MFTLKRKRVVLSAGIMALMLLFTAGIGSIQATEDEFPESAEELQTEAVKIENYIVQPGDTLWGIARERQVDVSLLAAVNDLSEDKLLLAGQEIKIPRENIVPHVVAAGETLWGIAASYNADIDEIISENEINNPDSLLAGVEILVPVNTRAAYAGKAPARNNWRLSFWPTFGTVSSVFGPREKGTHEGLDIAAEEGMPVRAVKSGQVVFAGTRGSYGNTVIINHGGGLRTLYAHNSEIVVTRGELVEEGREIARVGSSGHSTGPHLHFELLYRGTPLNPARYLPVRQ